MECNFCKSNLKTLSSFNYHIKYNKKCLDIQKNSSEAIKTTLVRCEFCNKQFANIKKHSCKMQKIKEIEDINITNNELKNNINQLKYENIKLKFKNKLFNTDNKKLINDVKKLETENLKMKEYIVQLETEKNIYSKDHDAIVSIAKQPKTTNNYNLCIYDDNIIRDRFSMAINNIKPSDLYDGQKSIGRFVVPCLQNDDGSKMVSCTDFARNVFIYKDINGNINKDIKCRNLANLIEPIATAKVNELMKEDYDKRTKINRIKILRKQIISRKEDIEKLEKHLQGLKKESQQWYYVKSQILQKENDNDIENQELQNINNEDRDDLILKQNDNGYCDEKLIEAADDIKEMKIDSSKFSKTISELV